MKIHTARQIISQGSDGKTAISVAKASGRSVENVASEAGKTLKSFKKRERHNRNKT